MSAKEMRSSVEAIEVEAEKILKEARSKANKILVEASETANKITSSELPEDEIKAEYDRIVNKAKKEANKRVEEAKEKTSEIQTEIGKKMDEITERVVSIITGAEVE